MPLRAPLFPYTTLFRSRIRSGDFTLRGLVVELAERGLKIDYRSVWEFIHGEKLSFKKKRGGWRTRSPRRRAAAGAIAFASHHRSEEHTSELQSLTNLVCRCELHSFPTRRSSDLGSGAGTSPCAGLSSNSPSAGSRSITDRSGSSSMARS